MNVVWVDRYGQFPILLGDRVYQMTMYLWTVRLLVAVFSAAGSRWAIGALVIWVASNGCNQALSGFTEANNGSYRQGWVIGILGSFVMPIVVIGVVALKRYPSTRQHNFRIVQISRRVRYLLDRRTHTL